MTWGFSRSGRTTSSTPNVQNLARAPKAPSTEKVPDDLAFYEVGGPLLRGDSNDTARVLAIFEKVGVPWREERNAPTDPRQHTVVWASAPFWACVIAATRTGALHKVLTHALAFPEWRSAAMAMWRLAGREALKTWVQRQVSSGEINTREQLRRTKQGNRPCRK